MKIDWKHLATTPGYKSLKAAYIVDVQGAADTLAKGRNPMRKKAEFLKLFNWVICRAKHYAQHTGRPIEDILNEWEEKRTCWWLNYYGEHRQPRFHGCGSKPLSLKGELTYHRKRWGKQNPRLIQNRLLDIKARKAKEQYSRAKPRWDNARKKRMARRKSL